MKRKTAFFLSLVILISFLSGCKVIPQSGNQVNNSEIYMYEGVEDFLLDSIKEDGVFMSSKLSNIESNSFEQTYYHLKIQEYFNLLVNEQAVTAFRDALNDKLKEDIMYLKYADILDYSNENVINIEEYIALNPEVTEDTVECYYIFAMYLGKENSAFNTEKLRQFLEVNIPTQTSVNNRLVMIYWYLNLCRNHYIDGNSIFLKECQDYLELESSYHYENEDFYKYENLYYYLWNCKELEIVASIDNEIIQNISERLPYVFLSSEIYYAVMCLDLQSQDFDGSKYFLEYYNFITPMVNNLYPSYVVEYDNWIEEYQTFLLLKYVFNSDDERLKKLENFLGEQTGKNLFATNSSTQSYYECLFCVQENIEISDEKLDLIRERLSFEKDKGYEAHNTKIYYYYLILDLAEVEIGKEDENYILSQYNYLVSTESFNLAFDFLGLIFKFNLMSKDEIENEFRTLSESANMTYSSLSLAKELNLNSESMHLQSVESAKIDNKFLIQDYEGVMYISTIYSYILSFYKTY